MNLKAFIDRMPRFLRQYPITSGLGFTLILWLSFSAIAQYRIHNPKYEHAMTSLTQNMQTHCFGRSQINLPAGTRTSMAYLEIDGVGVSAEPGIPHEEFVKNMNTRWLELQALTKDNYNRPYLKPSVKLEPIQDGVIFLYEHSIIKGSVLDGEPAESPYHESEGYLWRDGVLFVFKKALESEDDYARVMSRLEVRQINEMPKRPGICFGWGFVESSEFEPVNLRMRFDFPGNKKIGLIATQKYFNGESSKPLLQRRKEKRPINEAMFAAALKRKPDIVFGEHIFRFAKRALGKLDGEEITVGSTEKRGDFNNHIGSEWEYIGKSGSLDFPEITLEMGVSYTTTKAPSPLGAFPSKEIAPDALPENEYFALWDAILKSLRPRPVAPIVEQPKPLSDAGRLNVLPLGTQVSSLRSCPETGTYECSSNTPNIALNRVFIQKHRPMPSALIDAPKKGISGLLGRKEQQEIETTWTLVSYKDEA